MTVEEYTRIRLQKDGASPSEIDQIVAESLAEFGPAHIAQQMTQEEIAQVDGWCDQFRNAQAEVLDQQKREILARRNKKIEGN